MTEHIYESKGHSMVMREKIIRCRDCKHSRHENRYCSRDAYDGTEWLHIEPHGFCAWAEKVD